MAKAAPQFDVFRPPPGGTGRPLVLRVTSDPANLAPVRRACESFALEQGLGASAVGDVGLCVNEAMANIIRHAYHGLTDQPIEVRGMVLHDGIRLTLQDWGNGQIPTMRPEEAHNPESPGGLGLICMRRLMDSMTYTPQPDGMLLTMEKRRNQEPGKRGH